MAGLVFQSKRAHTHSDWLSFRSVFSSTSCYIFHTAIFSSQVGINSTCDKALFFLKRNYSSLLTSWREEFAKKLKPLQAVHMKKKLTVEVNSSSNSSSGFTPSSKNSKQMPTENLQSKATKTVFELNSTCSKRENMLKMPWRTWCNYWSQKKIS